MIRIRISNKQQQRSMEHAAGPLEFGRIPKAGVQRVVLDDPHVSRHQLRITECATGTLDVENLSERTQVFVGDGTSLAVGGRRELNLPVRLTAGMTLIEISAVEADESNSSLEPSTWQTISQQKRFAASTRENISLTAMADTLTPQTLAHWFETVITVQRAAAGSKEFYQETARAVVDLVGLDCGMVLLRRKGKDSEDYWEEIVRYSAAAGDEAEFSRTVLNRIVVQRRTFYQAAEIVQPTGSLMGVEAVVASPIFDPNDEVVGAVYGMRASSPLARPMGIRPLEAQVVQLLAAAVGAGLARVQREAEAARLRVQFEQFFSPELAQELERDPTLLDGRDRTLTILFSDIRGFSSVSESLEPADMFRLVRDVMERLTARVLEHAGVLVGYIGDGLMAMWNAPQERPNHAYLACKAALAMISDLPGLNEAWQGRVGQPLALGIGLNTGLACVGNTGSSMRFNYSPLGHAVNLASRVEGATKHLGVPVLISGETHSLLGGALPTRRLCQAKLQGIAAPVTLYELTPQTDAGWRIRCQSYELAQSLYEQGRFSEACIALKAALSPEDFERDAPSRSLLERATRFQTAPPTPFDPVVDFGQK